MELGQTLRNGAPLAHEAANGRLGLEDQDAVAVVGQAQLRFRADHALRDFSAQLGLLDLQQLAAVSSTHMVSVHHASRNGLSCRRRTYRLWKVP